MRIKKVILSLLLLSSLGFAQEGAQEAKEIPQANTPLKGKGFFIGLDLERLDVDSRVDFNSQTTVYNVSGDTDTYTEPAFKVGYQYYFTRVYFKYSSIDEETDHYTVESKSYEINLEYIPIIYRSKEYALRLITGLSIGYTDNEITSASPQMQANLIAINYSGGSENQAIYGAQIGLMLEMSMGLSAEVGYRYRKGDLIDSSDSSGNVTLETKRKQLYLGLNYMF